MWTRPTYLAIVGMLAALALPAIAQRYPMPSIDERFYREPWTIKARSVQVSLRQQVATVTVTDEIYNPQSSEIETEYLFPLPPRALVDQFTLMMNGQELCGTIMDAHDARQLYESIVRARRDPGLLEYVDCGLFRSSAFPLGPYKTASLTIQFTMICPLDGQRVEFWYPLNTGRCQNAPIEDFSLRCNIESDVTITSVYSPTADIEIERRSATHVLVTFENRHYLPPRDFQLFYETSAEQVAASLYTYWPPNQDDGFYLLMVNPAPADRTSETLAKNLVIVLDRSGSMSGAKIEQGRKAVAYLLDHLNPRDHFNIVAYSDGVESCFETLAPVSAARLSNARDFVDRIVAAGGTNIDAALATALEQCGTAAHGNEAPGYIVFLTDGLPTVGTVAEDEILSDTRKANKAQSKIFACGVGYDVNVRLLDKLAEENHGRSIFIRPNESIEAKVSSLYNRIRTPVMTDLKISLGGFSTWDNCPSELGDLFQEDQLIRVGRIHRRFGNAPLSGRQDVPCQLSLSGLVNGSRRSLTYELPISGTDQTASHCFVEKAWAVRRVGYILDEIQVHGRSTEYVDELIALSKKYGIVTPYTSFLADERRDLADVTKLRREALPELQASEVRVSGPQAHMDAAARSQLMLPSAHSTFADPSGFAKQIGASDQTAYESEASEVISTIRIVAEQTLYKRGDCWVTADAVDLDLTSDRDKIKTIQRFSDEYFSLLACAGELDNRILAAQSGNEKFLLKIGGQAYLIQ